MRRFSGISRRRKGAAFLTAFACLLACVLGLPEDGVAAEEAPSEVEEVVRLLLESQGLPEGVSFRQDVTFRALLATWRFHSEVEATSEGVKFQLYGAPAFVPETLPLDLVNLSQSFALFDLEVAGRASPPEGTLVLRGPRIDYPGTGPREATFWVDPQSWTVRRAEAEYPWGTLFVDQEYDRMGDFYVLRRQQARVTPFGFSLDVQYREYRLP